MGPRKARKGTEKKRPEGNYVHGEDPNCGEAKVGGGRFNLPQRVGGSEKGSQREDFLKRRKKVTHQTVRTCSSAKRPPHAQAPATEALRRPNAAWRRLSLNSEMGPRKARKSTEKKALARPVNGTQRVSGRNRRKPLFSVLSVSSVDTHSRFKAKLRHTGEAARGPKAHVHRSLGRRPRTLIFKHPSPEGAASSSAQSA
jgi:hypothetical protein